VNHAGISIESIKSALRENGLHATAARIAVLQTLREGHEHRTVDEIRELVLRRYPAIDPATVYRTLETLESHGLAVRVELGDRLTRWAHVQKVHHHLVCRRCKAVVEMDDAPFQTFAGDLERRYGVRVDMQHLVLHGLCPSCSTETT
jgi:Fe2+ or Zn2+ uptake regulation protein